MIGFPFADAFLGPLLQAISEDVIPGNYSPCKWALMLGYFPNFIIECLHHNYFQEMHFSKERGALLNIHHHIQKDCSVLRCTP